VNGDLCRFLPEEVRKKQLRGWLLQFALEGEWGVHSSEVSLFLPPSPSQSRSDLVMYDSNPSYSDFRAAWDQIKIVRPVYLSLFTFGETTLPYYLVCAPEAGGMVRVIRGDVRITRPLIITPENMQPEFEEFFESTEESNLMQFLLSRSAAFSHLRFANASGEPYVVSDHVEEAVAKLNRQLDQEEEDQVSILQAPLKLARMAPLKYAIERVWRSAPDNIQELRERGFLPQ